MQKTAISNRTRQKVLERDSYDGAPCCIYCGSPYGIEIHHFVERSRGGMGVEENLVCLCSRCHRKLHDTESAEIKDFIRAYLSCRYEDWAEGKQIVRKYE